MRWGRLRLYCPVCGREIIYDGNVPSDIYHSNKFGILCSKECYMESERKYARQILGKDDPVLLEREANEVLQDPK